MPHPASLSIRSSVARQRLVFALASVLVGFSDAALTARAAATAAPAASANVVAATEAPVGPRIDALFTKWDKPYSPGIILGVSRDGLTIYSRGYGMANLEHGIKNSPQTISESGSVAKQFTAAAIALLDVRKKLSLDDPIQKHLPELTAPWAKVVTLRMLLNHTGGLRDIHGLFDLLGRPSYSSFHENAEVLEVVSRQRDLNFAPGTEYLYSNTGFILLTIVVERVTGQNFATFCNENLFKPRNLQNTSWRSEYNRVVLRRASGYAPGPNGTFLIDSPYSNIYGNGGLFSTVGDWLTWTNSFDNATGEWAQVVKLLQTPSKLNDGTPLTYCLGIISTQYRGLSEISHGGSTSGYRTFLARFPEKKVAIALLANSSDVNASDLVHRVADIVLNLPAAPEPAAVTLSEANIAAHAGLYRDVTHDDSIEFTAKSTRLSVGNTALVPTGPHTFVVRSSGNSYVFSDPASGHFNKLTETAGKTVTEYTWADLAKPDAAKLAEYVGDYYSAELDVVVPVTSAADKLAIRVRPQPAETAKPRFADGFETDRGLFTFTRGSDGKVSGMTYTNGRVRRVVFVKR